MEKPPTPGATPHVLILPFPAQGHIKPTLCLAQLISSAGLRVTFLNTHHNHDHLSGDLRALASQFPDLHFAAIADGLPPDHPRTVDRFPELVQSIKTTMKANLREFLLLRKVELPVTCVIADGHMSIGIEVAEELGIHAMSSLAYGAFSLWTYFCLPKLIDEGKIPFAESDRDLDEKIGLPGMEELLRWRDLPSFCRKKDQLEHPYSMFNFFLEESKAVARASSIILNTFDDLEAPILNAQIYPKFSIYTVGPIHDLVKSQVVSDSLQPSESPAPLSGSLWMQDRSCMTWLDSQLLRSVVYITFGSLVKLSVHQLWEFWHGLVKCAIPFLWVIRPDSIIREDGDDEASLLHLKEARRRVNMEIFLSIAAAGTEDKSCMIEWAPQEEVLAHPAVGGFVTHGGWNSVLEAITAGVPMLCWPQFADHHVNSRLVSEVWGIGLEMEGKLDRSTVETMVRALMEEKREELSRSTDRISRLAHDSVGPSGSSTNNLKRLVEDIRKIKPKI
ncbi:hypothetical protein CRG98_036173 [Punica granatum]|uniref:Glycosyltransferase n=1 Tax=Punica granatum TaxID=22663 RepID=A0A2I0IJ99_PUNGR|nr:hypothetical protein CRG98_036173 [Punica granatum]